MRAARSMTVAMLKDLSAALRTCSQFSFRPPVARNAKIETEQSRYGCLLSHQIKAGYLASVY
jgi:hypothetical protein